MLRDSEVREFDTFIHTVGAQLLHAADLLTGDRHRAERRVERALTLTCLKWRHLEGEDPVRLAWRGLVAGYLDPWRQGPRAYRGNPPGPGGGEVLTALDRLSRVERAAVVLRLYARLDEHDAAEALGVPVETVSRACRRGLARIRPMTGATGRAGGPGGVGAGPTTGPATTGPAVAGSAPANPAVAVSATTGSSGAGR